MMGRSIVRVAGALILLAPTCAFASGHLQVPSSTQQFKSHRACVAALTTSYEADGKQIAAKKSETNGNTREVTLDTKGVERLGAEHARYEATLWFHNGRFDAKLNGTETSHTFQRRLRECQSKTLTVSGEDGFTMSTWDPGKSK